jgi:hypothetical protein
MNGSAEIALVEMGNQAVYKARQGGFATAALSAEQDTFTLLDAQGNSAQTLLAGSFYRRGYIGKADVF